jgi:hypothetical protein
MEKVVTIVKKGEEEKDYKYWLTRPIEERFDCAGQLLQLYFEMHPDVPQRLQRVYRIIDRKRR